MTQTFGDFVRAQRKSLGMTLVQFEAKTGIYASNMSDYESGKVLPREDNVFARLAVGLDTDEDFLEGMAALDRGAIPRMWSKDAEYMTKLRAKFLKEFEIKE